MSWLSGYTLKSQLIFGKYNLKYYTHLVSATVLSCILQYCYSSLHICVVTLVSELRFVFLYCFMVVLKCRCSVHFVVFDLGIELFSPLSVVGSSMCWWCTPVFINTSVCPLWLAHTYFTKSQSCQLIYYSTWFFLYLWLNWRAHWCLCCIVLLVWMFLHMLKCEIFHCI
jgi:ABC-type spermidine/putrescine transport system permease subunit II